MSKQEVDDFLALVEEPKRSTLEEMRRRILKVVPDAEECISYGMPAFRIDGRVVAGFAPFKKHLNYSPHSGRIFSQIPELMTGYVYASGSMQFAVDEPLPESLIEKLIELRLTEIAEQNAAAALKKKR